MSTTEIIEVPPVAPVGKAVADVEVDIQDASPTPDQTTEMPLQVGAVDDDCSLHRACSLSCALECVCGHKHTALTGCEQCAVAATAYRFLKKIRVEKWHDLYQITIWLYNLPEFF